jgi:hypothetical protein
MYVVVAQRRYVAGVERGFFAGETLYDPCSTRSGSR